MVLRHTSLPCGRCRVIQLWGYRASLGTFYILTDRIPNYFPWKIPQSVDEFFINFYLLYSWYPTKNRIYNQTEDPTLDLRQKAKKQSNTQDPKK